MGHPFTTPYRYFLFMILIAFEFCAISSFISTTYLILFSQNTKELSLCRMKGLYCAKSLYKAGIRQDESMFYEACFSAACDIEL